MKISITVEGKILLEQALAQKNLWIAKECGGNGNCGKCRVLFLEGAPEATPKEKEIFGTEELAAGNRLACQCLLTKDCVVEIADEILHFMSSEENDGFVMDSPLLQEEGNGACAIAVDIGTTTLGFALVDRESGRIERTLSRINSQRRYGADVLNRIQNANEGKQDELMSAIRKDLAEGIAEVRGELPYAPQIAMAGNTTMCHLLMGYPCEGLGIHPFEPWTLKKENFIFDDSRVILLPGASAFVGGDVIAGLLYIVRRREELGMDPEEPWMFLDLGTNGEMVLWTGKEFIATAAAAGPALEGGNISCGCPGIYGAINSVMIAGHNSYTKTIGGVPAVGICGSGLLDAISGLLRSGVVDADGRLYEDVGSEGFLLNTPGSRKQIFITQEDIRQFQMAKSAIAAGQKILVKTAGLDWNDMKQVYLAGGMGSCLSVSAASDVGLLATGQGASVKSMGNTSLLGCAKYLRDPGEGDARIQKILHGMHVFSLAQQSEFEEIFFANMRLGRME